MVIIIANESYSFLQDSVDNAAEHMLNLVEGKHKNVLSSISYKDIRTLLHDIASCSYPECNEDSLIIPVSYICFH